MRWNSPYKSNEYPKEKPWHWWFAWYPVKNCGQKFWLCWIPRRYVRYTIFGSYSYHPEYCGPEFSYCGNVLGEKLGRKHGPNKK